MLRWRALAAAFPGRRPAAVFDAVRCELRAWNRSTEGAFLMVGEQLAQVQAMAHKIAAEISAVAVLIGSRASEGSAAVLDNVLEFARQSSACAARTAQGMQQVSADALAICRPVSRVETIVRMFSVLGTLTRIEAARCQASDGGLSGLAGEVHSLAQEVSRQLDGIGGAAGALRSRSLAARDQVHVMARCHGEALPPLGRRVRDGVEKLQEQRQTASELAQRLAARSAGVSRAVGELVAGIQFQDITRQQIEHVLEALDSAAGDSRPSLSAPRPAPAQVARLQAAQIESTRSAFEGAVAGIREGLARIEKDVTGMMREVEHLLGVSGREGDSFFAALEADFALILKILESNAAGDRDLAETGSSLGETISQMSASAGSIQQIGRRMQLLALNAAIEAVRLGDTGTALATLADAIRTLAQESDERAAEMAGRVDAMRAASAGLQHLAGNCAASDHQITDLRRSVEELHSVQQETRQRCAAAAALAEQLAASICQTIQAFGGQEAVPQALRRASHALTELADESRPSSQAGGLEELAARYTMHSERAVHTAVTGGVVPVAVEAGPSDLGDNVELF